MPASVSALTPSLTHARAAASSLSRSNPRAARRGRAVVSESAESSDASNRDALAMNATSSTGRALTILALCEVADVNTIKKTGQIWVAPDEDCVVTRFLFAFPDGFITGGGAGGLPADSTAEAFEDEVRRCIAGLSE